MPASAERPHLPYPAPIEAYGAGGFRFAGLSHRGSLLCLPDGIWAWPVASPEEVTAATLGLVFERAAQLDLLIFGTGRDLWIVPPDLREGLRGHSLKWEAMPTSAAIRTYNVLVVEGRRVAAGLIAA
ncbi:MAG TPA: MTH938/NDUFAF3 family protein [Xanthobacteraceae bacterium]